MGSGSLLKVLAKNFDVLAGPLVALAYPLVITAYVYQNYVRPVFVKNQMVNIWYVPQKKGLFSKSDDFLVALDKFIQENGPEALKKLTDKAGKSSKQTVKLWKGSKESKSSKELKEPKASKDAKDSKPSKDSKSSKDSKEQKKALKDSKEQKKAFKDSKEQKKELKDWKEHTALKDWEELKTSLKDSKAHSNEPTPKKSSKHVTFSEVELEKEFKASNSDWHPTSDYRSAYPEHNSWNSSFMIFDDEHSYWN